MMPIDPADPRLDGFRRLSEPRFRKRYESERGVFIAEGPTVVDRIAAHAGVLIEALLVDERARHRVPAGLDAPVYVVAQSVVAEVVGFDFHRGVLALCRRPAPSSVAHLATLGSLAVLEGINDHVNLGSIIRAAAGLGIGGVLLDPTTADPWYRRSVRVSMGTVADVPMGRSADLPADLDRLRSAGMTLVAATPRPGAEDVDSVGTVPRPAILLGAEGPGLSAASLDAADIHIRIPMVRDVDSLNVGQAAALLFHHLTRS
ncbi:MAG: RNA methyltransferase [Acidimicrobiia bacterium]|nr:RNA methyltransferase [Acidimicrobiia bacterium]